MENYNNERRKKFFPTISLGNVLTIIAMAAAGTVVYTQLYADVEKNKTEIKNFTKWAEEKERRDTDSKREFKRDVDKLDGKLEKVGEKLDRILEEMAKRRP